MFKHIFQKFYKKKTLDKKFVLVGVCIKTTEENYLLYDEAEQALEYVYHWYEHTDAPYGARMANGGYFPVTMTNIVEIMDFSRYVHTLLENKALPVLFSNCSESFTECIADFSSQKIGVINLNQNIDLVSGFSFVPMQSYNTIITEKNDVEMLSIGVYEEAMTYSDVSMAESLGVSWVNSTLFNSMHTEKLFRKLDTFLLKRNLIALNIDLRTIVRGMTIQPPFALDLNTILLVIQRIMSSNNVILVHFTGDSENLIFSNEAKKALDVIRIKQGNVNHKV